MTVPGTCRDCTHFENDPRQIEAQIEEMIRMPEVQDRPGLIVKGQIGQRIVRMNVQNDSVEFQ